MTKYTRRLKERKEKDGKNIEFKVECNTVLPLGLKKGKKIIKRSTQDIIKDINSGNYDYYVSETKTKVHVVGDYLRSSMNESNSDNIDSLPIY